MATQKDERVINTLLLPVVVQATEMCIGLFGDRDNWRGRRGGGFCLADAGSGMFYTVALIGETPQEKTRKYLELCQEKARRLAQHPEHVSSWQTRNPPERWGGAIRADEHIFSFSGLPELGDEALMLKVVQMYADRVGARMAMDAINDALNVRAVVSGNPYWAELRDFK